MNLVRQRDQWKQGFRDGQEPFFPAFHDYKKNRNSEYFRLSASVEEFFEYVLYLEEKLHGKQMP